VELIYGTTQARTRLVNMNLFLLILCIPTDFSTEVEKSVRPQKVEIAVTTLGLSDIVETIGGEHVKVIPLVPGAVDPHKVTPRASMLLKLSRADALASMGLGYEHAYLPALLEKVGRKDFGRGDGDVSQGGVNHFVASDFIGVALEIPVKLDRGAGVDVHPLGNSHWNTNPHLMRKVAVGLRDFLCLQQPQFKEDFFKNWEAWDKKAGELIAHWTKWLSPAKAQSIVTYHRSWSYFAQSFGLVLRGEVEPKPGMPPTTRHLIALSKTMTEHKVKVILMEPWYSEGKLGNLPTMTGAKVVKVASVSGNSGYLDWMRTVVSSVAGALDIPEPMSGKF
jgi:zinc/manganese transport system substrate-binding protein